MRSNPRPRSMHGDTEAWKKLQQNGMAKDFSWTRQVKPYEELYAGLLR